MDSPKETHMNDSRFLAAAGERTAFKTFFMDAITTRIFWSATTNGWFLRIPGSEYVIITSKLASCVRVPFILNDQAFAKAVIARQSGVAFNLNSRSMTIVCVENQHH